MDISLDEAMASVEACFNRNADSHDQVVALRQAIQSYDFGWVFFCQPSLCERSGAVSAPLAGNAPIIVVKEIGSRLITGTAGNLDVYLEKS